MQPSDTSPAPDGGRMSLFVFQVGTAYRGLGIGGAQPDDGWRCMVSCQTAIHADPSAAYGEAEAIRARVAQALAGAAAGAGAVPEGHVLVAREPTPEMLEAGTQAEREAVFTGDYHDPDPADVSRDSCREGATVAYRAMIAAAVPPQAAPAAAEPGPGERGIAPPGGTADLAEMERALDEALTTAWDETRSPASSRPTQQARQRVLDLVSALSALRRRPEPSGDAAWMLTLFGHAWSEWDSACHTGPTSKAIEARRKLEDVQSALSGHIAALVARIAEQDTELAALRTSAGATVEVSAETEQAIADALEAADSDWSMSLVRLVDGISTYEARYHGEKQDFDNTDDAYAWIGDHRRKGKVRAVLDRLNGSEAQDRAAGAERGEAK